jgi:signal transduction histidine kinase
VTIKLEEGSGTIKIIIKDTGIGIAKENLKNLFNKTFERGQEAQQVFVTGRGIGLFVAKEIITAHNGKIWAESAGEGQGSTFYIELPQNQ